MPEYLAPGVYVEEVSFRSRSVEAVATSTLGMVGATQYGPVPYPADVASQVAGDGAVADRAELSAGPHLVTSLAEYERLYGGLDIDGQPCQLALAARGFFENGGRRLFVQRAYRYPVTDGGATDVSSSFASLDLPVGGSAPLLQWRARWPGSVGARIRVGVRLRRSENVVVAGRLTDVAPGAAVETAALVRGRPPATPDTTPPVPGNVRLVMVNGAGELGYDDGSGGYTPVNPAEAAFHLTLDVEVRLGDRTDTYRGLELGRDHDRSISTVMALQEAQVEGRLVWLHQPSATGGVGGPGELLDALLTLSDGAQLTGGGDGGALTGEDLRGRQPDPADVGSAPLGLAALEGEEEISIVAVPDTVTLPPGAQGDAVDSLIDHCERMRYRVAVVDPPRDSSVSDVQVFRSRFDTSRAALYYPWLRILDPARPAAAGAVPATLDVPPSGYVAGVYARTDAARGVHKGPANELLLGVAGFVTTVTAAQQDLLNPQGVNVLRSAEGRGNRVWGARTMSSDPEWKYVNVRRFLDHLQASIDRSTRWAVFEPNDERLWASVQQSIKDFLSAVWRTGALMGSRPQDAYLVRCDRTTMTQSDLDSGDLVCLVGVAPLRPAEFVIFRIRQVTADATP